MQFSWNLRKYFQIWIFVILSRSLFTPVQCSKFFHFSIIRSDTSSNVIQLFANYVYQITFIQQSGFLSHMKNKEFLDLLLSLLKNESSIFIDIIDKRFYQSLKLFTDWINKHNNTSHSKYDLFSSRIFASTIGMIHFLQ